jgi:predicted NBD/HSP70 family sugar kinase
MRASPITRKGGSKNRFSGTTYEPGILPLESRASGGGTRRVDFTEVKASSTSVCRKINRDILLQLTRSRQPVSRADLSRLSGLEPSTVSEIVEQLIREGWINEGLLGRPSSGRPPTLFSLNDNLVVLAVDVRPTQAVIAVVDVNSHVLTFSLQHLSDDLARVTTSLIDNLKRIRANYSSKSFVGIGISFPVYVDRKSRKLVFGSRLLGPTTDFERIIEQEMDLTVEIENTANSCLMSELWFGRMEGIRNSAMVTVSEGISVGILADGSLITGHHGTAGDFAHIPFDSSGPPCECGQTGCWESMASNKAALRHYRELIPEANGLSYQDLLDLALGGDQNAQQAVARQAAQLGRGLRIIACALSPEVMLVAGDLTSAWEQFAPILEGELSISKLPGVPPRLQPIRDGDVTRLRGAAALLLQRRAQIH